MSAGPPRVLAVAGAASGVGKTTVTVGLLEAFRRRGLVVQAFKVGPDFIDPAFLALVTGRPSPNLDGWMCGREWVVATAARAAADADLALIEGVMGCFDGSDATGEEGSTAQVAKWLGAPVVLVVDASGLSRSVAAVVQGFERFDPALRVAAVIANRVGGEVHGRWIREAVGAFCRAVAVGAIAHDEALRLPERHLGLVTALEGALTAERRARLADLVEASLDLDHLLAIAQPLSSGAFAAATEGGRLRKGGGASLRVKIGVARDAAFQFYYPENLDLLGAAGAELVFWSPLGDALPAGLDGLYLGGGYPELHARALAQNTDALEAVAEFAAAGKPVYAECGGLMYLADTLEDMEGTPHRMAGLLPTAVHLRPGRLTLGYTEVETLAPSPLGAAGSRARGHEFHRSTIDPVPEGVQRVYRLRGRGGGQRLEGYRVGQALMSYVHLHFGSNPDLAPALVEACAAAQTA